MSSVEGKRDLKCVGEMKIVKPKPVGGSIPVLADNSFPTFSSAPLPPPERMSAPSYRMLWMGTDLNLPPVQTDDFTEKMKSRITGEVDSNLRKKCESLAVSGFVEYESDLDVIAPVEILKQIFRTPYSKSQLSIAVQRVGKTLVLNPGPGFDSKEHNNRPGCDSENVDKTNYWFLNFVMHSMRMEGCDCSPEQISEKIEPSGDSEKHRRSGSNEFSRVVDCQFDEFHMRLSSDLILFSNENGAAVSLHLSDLSQQVTPLTWLEAWLDNVMASVPELAICYHQAGIVEGYELLKTDDIYLPNGVSGDAPAFDPVVVQQNGLVVLRFLQSNCKEDPGVYWLYKSAGEDVIQLFDLSKNLSSSATPLPPLIKSERSKLGNLLDQVVQAHEQFVRLILEFDLTTSGTSLDISHVCQDPANNVQRKVKIADLEEESRDIVDHKYSFMNSVSGTSAAVCHVYEAIKFLMQMHKLESSEQEGWLPTSKLDGKLWSLVRLLGESYLSLGVSYKENGQLHQALKTVELACHTYGSMPHKFEETSFASALHKSFALQLNLEKFEELVSKSTTQVEDLEAEPSKPYISLGELSSISLFWGNVWLLVGEIHVRFQVLRSGLGKPEGTSTNQLRMPSEVEEEVERLKKKLTALSQPCGSCSLASCSCPSKSRNKKLPSNKDKFVRGGIYKYLESSMKDDGESNWIAALDCFEESRRALVNLPSGCEEIKSIITRKAIVWNEIGRSRVKSKKFKEAEEASAHAISAFKESCDLTSTMLINYNMGLTRQDRAEANFPKIESTRHPTKKKAHKQALEDTTLEYTTSIKFFKAAEADLNLAIEKGIVVPENIKVDIYRFLGHAYLKLGMFLYKENTIATAAHGLKSVSDSSPNRLSAVEAIEEAIVVYENLGEVGKENMAFAYNELAGFHKQSCLRCLEPERQVSRREPETKTDVIDRAKQHASLADKSWQKVIEFYCSQKSHSVFLLKTLIRRSEFSFNLPWRTYSMLESDLCNLLEGRHIDEESLTKDLTKDFWALLRKVVMEMLKKRADKPKKLRQLCEQILRAKSLIDVNEIHSLWSS